MRGTRIKRWWSMAVLAAALLISSGPAIAQEQDADDRADSAIAVEDERIAEPTASRARRNDPVADARNVAATSMSPFVAGAIRIDGAVALPQAAFARAI